MNPRSHPGLPDVDVGIVTDVADPLGIGRVRFQVPGVIEPASRWAFPLATLGGGPGIGGWFVPPRGSMVAVFFFRGDPDTPFYLPAHWAAPGGQGEPPTFVRGVPVGERHLMRGIETEHFKLVFDDRPGHESFELVMKGSEDGIAYDGVTRSLRIKSTTAIVIEAIGAVKIDGAAVTIAGRPVMPGAGPI